jgi:allophanate hydrolase subunit 2
MTIENPNNDFLKSRSQLQLFRQEFRRLLDKIKLKHGQGMSIHIFPSVPVSIAVEIGRVRQPKADLPFVIYDQNNKTGGFIHALNIGEHEND